MKNCIQCGTRLKTKKENFRHPALGLSNVTLIGLEVSRCPQCGEYYVAVPRLGELLSVLAQAVASKAERLTPEEIRFLRKRLQWSGADFAEHFDVTPQTVSRWENGKQPMGAVAERLLRLCALSYACKPIDDISVLKGMAKSAVRKRQALRLSLTDHWSIAA